MIFTAMLPVSTSRLLLILAVTASVVVQRVDGETTFDTYSTTDGSSALCPTELAACGTDDTCTGCLLTVSESSAEVSDCRVALGYGETGSSTSGVCSDNVELFCCLDEVAEEECLDNDDFAEYYRCLMEAVGCTDEDITCDGGTSSFAGTSSTPGDVATPTNDDAADDSTPVCSAEIDACGADDTCTRCMLVAVMSSDEISDCRTSLHLDEIESSTAAAACSDYVEVICCHDEIAEDECLDNDGFVEYYTCLLESVGCADEAIACTGATSSSNAGASTPGGATTPTTDDSTTDFISETALTADDTTGDSTSATALTTDDTTGNSISAPTLTADDTTTVDSTSACSTETYACVNDDTCASCLVATEESSEEVEECLTALGLDEVESSTVSCSDHMDVICCYDDVAQDDCLDNDAFVEYFVCLLERVGCSDDEIVCSGASSGFRSPPYAVVFSCTFAVLLLQLLWA